jgi:predicted ATPase
LALPFKAGWLNAELLRVKGEYLLLRDVPGAAAAAEDHFRQALDWACQQGALSWELRAATSLARLWRDQARSKEARELLAPVYDRFAEGFTSLARAMTEPDFEWRAKRESGIVNFGEDFAPNSVTRHRPW